MSEGAGPRTECPICAIVSPEPIGLLCRRCAAALAGKPRCAPGIVRSHVAATDAAAWVIDAWGQLHPIGASCRIGRDQKLNDLTIADLRVSGEHADLRRQGSQWWLRDRGSANGSGVGNEPRVRKARVEHRARLWLGGVAVYLWAQPEPPALDVPPPDVRTLVPNAAAFHLAGPNGGELIVRPARGHAVDRAPGELEYTPAGADRPKRAPLPRLQFQLLRALCEAAIGADDAHTASVGTHELVARLPFQTARPEPNHVRQVVSTLRATLHRAGVPGGDRADTGGVIYASEGLGYRVTWEVSRLGADTDGP